MHTKSKRAAVHSARVSDGASTARVEYSITLHQFTITPIFIIGVLIVVVSVVTIIIIIIIIIICVPIIIIVINIISLSLLLSLL